MRSHARLRLGLRARSCGTCLVRRVVQDPAVELEGGQHLPAQRAAERVGAVEAPGDREPLVSLLGEDSISVISLVGCCSYVDTGVCARKPFWDRWGRALSARRLDDCSCDVMHGVADVAEPINVRVGAA